MWKQIEPTPAHLSYLVLSLFLIVFALFSLLIRNRLHVSEPPLAMLTGIMFGPKVIGALDPMRWGFNDIFMQEFTRIIVGLQVFAVGLELPRRFFSRHWQSVLWMLGPVMTVGWLVCALLIWAVLLTDGLTALTIAATLTPTDPVLAASILTNSQFSRRVPAHMRHLLSAESGCNDGVSFPFLYVGLHAILNGGVGAAVGQWVGVTLLWQCVLGTLVGGLLGFGANQALRFSDDRKFIGPASFLVFYLLLAILSIGIASIMGLDDFLVAFFAGVGFSHDGWFAHRTRESRLNTVLDLVLNSAFFVFFGAIIPWDAFQPHAFAPHITPTRLFLLLVLILLFRRLPIVYMLQDRIPDIKTWREALFAGHFGPMGVGALFLAIEARAQLETETSLPKPHPPSSGKHLQTIELIWPTVAFIVFGSTLVHGLSVAAISVFLHYTRREDDRADIVGGETEPLWGMDHEDSSGEETQSEDDEEAEEEAQHHRQGITMEP